MIIDEITKMSDSYKIKKILIGKNSNEINFLMANAVCDGWNVEQFSVSERSGHITAIASTDVNEILLPLGEDKDEILNMAQSLYAERLNRICDALQVNADEKICHLVPETRYEKCVTVHSGNFEFNGRKFALAKCTQRINEPPFLALVAYQVPSNFSRHSHTAYQR
jgi:hypothetical protein